ncbi:hypothetical protein FIE12Z_6858 [Fusarium flagelliforme]|uniref:Ubiquitin-like domain-containing protein n=1 Tax=Fusarium flagelliforme TaxID=2675880 RepID=A0A395MN31_9HYPO|nr:hypothetical protein FIE12Z_6858 [Fusarium flagelliforme]
MDPISIAAILAGIWQVVKTGTSLSKDIHRFVASIQNAPREILDIAARISDLSFILGELHGFLENNKDLCKRRLLKIINSTMGRISKIHNDLKSLMDGHTAVKRLLWVYNKPEVQYKLSVIESHKSGIQLIQNTLLLAALTRKESKSQKAKTKVKPGSKDGKKKKESRIPHVRQQAENLTYAACNHITELSKQQRPHRDGSILQLENDDNTEGDEKNKLIQFRALDKRPDETATWLFNLVFEPLAQSRQGPDSQSIDTNGITSEVTIGIPTELQTAIYEPGVSSSIVEKLLADWTTEEENIKDPGTEQIAIQETNDCKCTKGGKESITFNAVGQQFTFPFHLIRKWKGMEQKIKEALGQHEVLGSQILNGHYDVVGPTGSIIMPNCWRFIIEPGMDITLIIPPISNKGRTKASTNLHPQPGKKVKSPKVVSADPGVLSTEQRSTKKTKPVNQNKTKTDAEGSGVQGKKGKQ